MKFTKSHEWIQVQGSVGTVGITRYAAEQLGEIVNVQLPKAGAAARAGQEICVLESTKAAADVYSPVSGKVIAVNEKALESINRDPEGSAWLFKVELANLDELASLLSKSDYEKMIG